MISEQEFYSTVVKHTNVGAAFDKAISTATEMANGATRPGLWCKAKLARLTFDNARAMSELLTVYGTTTGYRCPPSEMDCLEKIVFMAANHPDRKLTLIGLATCGWPDGNEQSTGEPRVDQADLPDIEAVEVDLAR